MSYDPLVGRPIRNSEKSWPCTTVDEAELLAFTQLFALNEYDPAELPKLAALRTYWRPSAPILIVWLRRVVTHVPNNWTDCDGSMLAPLNPSVTVVGLVAPAKPMTGI